MTNSHLKTTREEIVTEMEQLLMEEQITKTIRDLKNLVPDNIWDDVKTNLKCLGYELGRYKIIESALENID